MGWSFSLYWFIDKFTMIRYLVQSNFELVNEGSFLFYFALMNLFL